MFQILAVEWPFGDVSPNGGRKATEGRSGLNGGRSGEAQIQSIADYLSQKKIDLVINLPMRLHQVRHIVTKGYITRRMAVEYSVPLITDIKCAKLLVKV